MLIYGRNTLNGEQLWQLYTSITDTTGIWLESNFKESAKACGLRRVVKRKAYFSFEASNFTTGQAIINKESIEEIRFFIGNEPSDLDEATFLKDRNKPKALAKEFTTCLTEKLGTPRQLNNNNIFESNGFRTRVLATASANVWVVISNLAVQKQLGVDYFAQK